MRQTAPASYFRSPNITIRVFTQPGSFASILAGRSDVRLTLDSDRIADIIFLPLVRWVALFLITVARRTSGTESVIVLAR